MFQLECYLTVVQVEFNWWLLLVRNFIEIIASFPDQHFLKKFNNVH